MEVSMRSEMLGVELPKKEPPRFGEDSPLSRQGSGRLRPSLSLQTNGTPTRPRKPALFDLGGNPPKEPKGDSDFEVRLKKIMSVNGLITVNGKSYKTSKDDLEQLGELGFGSCGHVVKVRHTPSNSVIAVKEMRRSGNREENKRITMDLEVVLKSHDCPYIVKCLGCFISDADVWICMELMATCFEKLLKKLQKPIPEQILGKVAVATIKALSYLKEKHEVIHRDVKPSNILLDDRGNIKLCDFGISGWLEDSKAKTRSAGCAAYMAPERIEPPDPSHPNYDIRADVWALGITLVELATGQFPYKDCTTDFELLARVLKDDPPMISPKDGFSHEFCSFIQICLIKNYKNRPKYKKLLEHAFIKKYDAMEVDVAGWYSSVTSDPETFKRTSSKRGSARFTPPSPGMRRVTSDPPPIPPRTPDSQRKPLIQRLTSNEALVEQLGLFNGRSVVQIGSGGITVQDANTPQRTQRKSEERVGDSPSVVRKLSQELRPEEGEFYPTPRESRRKFEALVSTRGDSSPNCAITARPTFFHSRSNSNELMTFNHQRRPSNSSIGSYSQQSPTEDSPSYEFDPLKSWGQPSSLPPDINGRKPALEKKESGPPSLPLKPLSTRPPVPELQSRQTKELYKLPGTDPKKSHQSSLSDSLMARLTQDATLSRFLGGNQSVAPQPRDSTQQHSRRISVDSSAQQRRFQLPANTNGSSQPPAPARRHGSSSVPASPLLPSRHARGDPYDGPPPLPPRLHLTPEPPRRVFGNFGYF